MRKRLGSVGAEAVGVAGVGAEEEVALEEATTEVAEVGGIKMTTRVVVKVGVVVVVVAAVGHVVVLIQELGLIIPLI